MPRRTCVAFMLDAVTFEKGTAAALAIDVRKSNSPVEFF
jgi:hypothetical protein